MRFTIITLYPKLIQPYLNGTILGRAQDNGHIIIDLIDLRSFGKGRHKQVDDTPYGGGPGMLLRPDVVVPAIRQAQKLSDKSYTILLSPEGKLFDQPTAQRYSKLEHLILVCGRFEGFDARIKTYCDNVVSVGPFVVAGGELPALVVLEATSRLVNGVLGNKSSLLNESYNKYDKKTGLSTIFEYPQYTKPETFEEQGVPKVLLSGDHSKINKWRLERTK